MIIQDIAPPLPPDNIERWVTELSHFDLTREDSESRGQAAMIEFRAFMRERSPSCDELAIEAMAQQAFIPILERVVGLLQDELHRPRSR